MNKTFLFDSNSANKRKKLYNLRRKTIETNTDHLKKFMSDY